MTDDPIETLLVYFFLSVWTTCGVFGFYHLLIFVDCLLWQFYGWLSQALSNDDRPKWDLYPGSDGSTEQPGQEEDLYASVNSSSSSIEEEVSEEEQAIPKR